MWSELCKLLLLLVVVLEGQCQFVRLPGDDIPRLLYMQGRPIDVSNAVDCYRQCSLQESPRLCYYRFIAENFMTNGRGCDLCTPNATNSLLYNCECVIGDGFERSVLAINRQIPGPTIQVCKDDFVVVDVSNKIQGQELSIHWHGILQRGTQYYDGVPYVTQCPISEGTTFRYQWRAEQAGTHFWHSHSGLQEMNGIYGSIVVREPDEEEVHKKLYDDDVFHHVFVISDWMHELAEEHFPGRRVNLTGQYPSNFLINGKGLRNHSPFNATNIETFQVNHEWKHRFRMINAFGSTCPSALTIENHNLIVIAVDGNPVEPVMVDAIVSFAGERYDFILHANQPPGTYWMQLTGLGGCEELKIFQIAQIVYTEAISTNRPDRPYYEKTLRNKIVLNPFDDPCDDDHLNNICINNLRSIKPIDPKIMKKTPDLKIYLSFLFRNLDTDAVYRSGVYNNYLVAPTGGHVQSLINNISFVPTSSPLLSQFDEIPKSSFCTMMDHNDCQDNCQCTHLIQVDLNTVIELIVIDEAQVPELSHPFHLHGHEFYVMNMLVPQEREIRQTGNGNLNVQNIIKLDKKSKFKRNFDRPPAKDTLAVPRSGIIIVRFRATNPGFWLLHCHFQFHVVIGMSLVLRVGKEKHLPMVPLGFPRCGDFTPPMFPDIWSLDDSENEVY